MPHLLRRVPVLACALAVAAGASARAAPGDPVLTPGATVLTLQAQGESRPAPDMAGLTLGVTTTAPTAAAAQARNAGRMAAVVDALHRAGLAGRDLQTASISLAPQYAYEEGRPPRATGYQASNTVTAVVRDLRRLPAVLDAVAGAGADEVRGPDFGLSDPQSAADAARRQAMDRLGAEAALYARAAGLRVARLASLSETAAPAPELPHPVMFARAMAAKAPTPVETGEVAVRVEVTAVYELAR